MSTTDGGRSTSGPIALRLDGAAVDVGGRTIWSGVDVTVRQGEFVAVLGPNGVGKSTMIKVLLGLLPLAAGTAEVLGRAPGGARGDIGYLPQRRSFDAGLRIRGIDLVGLGLDGHRWGFPLPGLRRRTRGGSGDGDGRDERRRRVDEAIDLVEATPYARRPIGELSGGEQQRLLIAQALVQQPRMLLLDEPLDSLDLPNQASVAGLVDRICREREMTVLLVAHDVNPIYSYLDRVIYLGQGGAAIGPPAEVVTSATLSRLYDAPIEVLATSDGRLVVVGQPEAPSHHHDRHGH